MSSPGSFLCRVPLIALACCATVLVATGCGSSSSPGAPSAATATKAAAVNPNGPEVSPAGDIPDNQAYVSFSPSGSGYSVKVPEGWARTTTSATTAFTDKLNRIQMQQIAATAAPTVADAKRTLVPELARTTSGFKAQNVSTVTRTAGPAVRITYLARSPQDPVTGKSHTDAVERYVFFHNGKSVVLTLSGPKGADNVDPWKMVTDSLRYTR